MIAIAGATGFIGGHLARYFAEKRTEKVRLHGYTGQAFDLGEGKGDSAEWFFGDLTEMGTCLDLCDGVDTVFMCAAVTGGAHEMVYNPLVQVQKNLVMNANMMQAAKEKGVKKFLFVSSGSVYPTHSKPVNEDMGFVGEPMPPYRWVGQMKRTAEIFGRQYAADGHFRFGVVRPSNVYGLGMESGERAHMIPALIKRALDKEDPFVVWGSKYVIRDYLYATDLVGWLIRTWDMLDDNPYLVFNAATGAAYQVKDVVKIILDATGHRPNSIIYDKSKPSTAAAIMPSIELSGIFGMWSYTSLFDGIRYIVESIK